MSADLHQHRDVIPDDMQSIRESEDGIWRFEDCGHVECEYHRADLAMAFVSGKFHSMLLERPETNLTCGVYDRNGILLDTITSQP